MAGTQPEIKVRTVTLWLCDLCLDGAGGECHRPGCSLWMHKAPVQPVRDSQGVTVYDGEETPETAAISVLYRSRHSLTPDILRSLADIWNCASAARYGKPHEAAEYGPEFYASHDVAECEDDPWAPRVVEGLNSGLPVQWAGDPVMGGYVCAVSPGFRPGSVCGMPVESEPCTIHREP